MKRARWYMTYIEYCPLCGFERFTREARYDDPPPKELRYEHSTIAYHCGF